jgi:3-oxoacyl-[acyl-carrier protein] reductase
VLTIDFADRVAVVTGGLGAIGRAIATTLQSGGAKVAAWDLAADAGSSGNGVASYTVDVTSESAVEAALSETMKQFGRIDILVNAAGLVGREDLLERLSLKDWQKVIDVNLTSVFLCSRAMVPIMRKQGYGRIINIASNAGKDCNPYQSAYGAAKAAVIGLTKSLGRELAESGVLVNCVTPVLIDTPLAQALEAHTREAAMSKIPMRRMGRPDEVAQLVAWLSSEHCSFSTGAAYDISGGRASY